ncbi:helix-turn-helix domain-containing protein [Kitasatospora sp. NBC_01560]|uniref:ArsR/SmtB family transcription factor n=1 Tax=Kitasatospora sp. NBC_01560 TaxID=2975965 RepID=UPI0038646906
MTEEQRWPHGPDPQNDVVVLDAKGLRALAHPVRVQLVGLLRRHGPSTATRLAERMGLTSGATSYHLRQLAAAGFVAEDTERGNARERWWKPLHQTTWWSDRALADEEPEAAFAYLRSIVAANALTTQRALNGFETMPRAWRHSFDLSDWSLLLTPEEARSLAAEMAEVVGRYRRADTKESAPEGAERVAVVLQVLPDPEGEPDGPPGGSAGSTGAGGAGGSTGAGAEQGGQADGGEGRS